VVDAAVTVSSGIGSVKAKRWQGGAIGAAKIASIATTGAVGTKTTLPIPGDFAADVILDADDVPARGKTLTSATVKGSVAPSVWDVTGAIGAITINGDVGAASGRWVLSGATSLATLTLGDVVDAAVTVSSGIGSVKAKRWQGGAIGAAKIASITTTGAVGTKTTLPIPGDFAADVTLTDATAKLSLGRMTIAGGVLGATISSAGPLGTFTLGAIRDSTIQAGDMDDNRTSIGSLTVRDVKGQTYAFVNSNVSAYALGRISVRGVDPVSPGHVTFGITGHTMTSYSRDGKATAKIQPGIVDQLDHYVVQLS